MSKEGLTTKQRLFVEYYLGGAKGNATEAARMAGYRGTDATLRTMGAKLVAKGNISALVTARVSEAAMPANEVLRELSDIARADWREFLSIKYDREGKAIDATLLLKDKIKALELLGKHHRLFDRAGEATDLLSMARRAVAEFLAEHPSVRREDIAPIYAQTFGVKADELITEAIN